MMTKAPRRSPIPIFKAETQQQQQHFIHISIIPLVKLIKQLATSYNPWNIQYSNYT